MELPDNFVHLRGEVLRDSEVRHTKNGSPVFNFTLAVAGYKRDKYVDCVAFDSVVDQFEGFMQEGEDVEIFGSLSERTWTDPSGIKQTRDIVRCNRVIVHDEQEEENGD